MDIWSFYKNKRVLVTGHTGFKGSWLTFLLKKAGAEVCGYSSGIPTSPSLFEQADIADGIRDERGDVRDGAALIKLFDDFKPEIVFHLAAQPIVRESYINPVYTYETNVMGTVNVLEAIRHTPSVKSFLNVTTDKVYFNREWEWGYRENDPLDGFEPYSNSKSCSELVTHSYKNSFFNKDDSPAISTARAGNVIGGGDYAADRIIPDCIRYTLAGKKIEVRNPYSIRPYQHVLEPLYVYLTIAAAQYEDKNRAGNYNVGPSENDCLTTGELTDCFVSFWGDGAERVDRIDPSAPHEANYLKLDCSRLRSVFGWRPRWDVRTAVKKCVEFAKGVSLGEKAENIMERQISEFFNL